MKNLQPTTYNLQLIKILSLVVGCWSLVLPTFVFADTVPANQDFSYALHLFYDNGQLFADRDFQFKYDVIPEKFVPEVLNTGFPYKGEVIDLNNKVAGTFQFDPRRGDPKFLKGKISVKAPYLPDGQKVNFYDNQGRQLLSVFVNLSSFCNDDGVCNSDVGEDAKTCPNDCQAPAPTPLPVATPGPSTNKGGLMGSILYVIAGGLIIGGWFGWKWWQKRAGDQAMDFPMGPTPPAMPPTSPIS